jgi:hypothetical protein
MSSPEAAFGAAGAGEPLKEIPASAASPGAGAPQVNKGSHTDTCRGQAQKRRAQEQAVADYARPEHGSLRFVELKRPGRHRSVVLRPDPLDVVAGELNQLRVRHQIGRAAGNSHDREVDVRAAEHDGPEAIRLDVFVPLGVEISQESGARPALVGFVRGRDDLWSRWTVSRAIDDPAHQHF